MKDEQRPRYEHKCSKNREKEGGERGETARRKMEKKRERSENEDGKEVSNQGRI